MNELDEITQKIQKKFGIIGRASEIEKILIAYFSNKNILIEGDVGTGKTTIAHAFAKYMDKEFFRVDGSEDILSHVFRPHF